MMRLVRWPSPAMIVASTALLVALGGVGVAATGLPAASVGTLQLKNDAVTSVKVKNGSLLGADFRAGQIPRGPAGRAGPTGAAGPKGDKGDPGSVAKMWAVVDAGGNMIRQSGVSSVAHPNVGTYDVTFAQSVANCAVVATPKDAFWSIGVAYTGDTAQVTIDDLDEDEDDQDFTILAVC